MEVIGDQAAVIGGVTLARVLRVMATWPAARQRALVAAMLPHSIQCGARVDRKARRAARYFAQRAPRIDAMREVMVEQLELAKAETLGRLKAMEMGKGNREKASTTDALESAEGARTGVTADVVFDLGRWKDGLLAALRSEAAEALQEAGEMLMEELGEVDPFRMPNPVAVDFLDSRENLLSGMADEVHASVVATVQEGMEAQLTQAEMARALRTKFAEMEEGRAETVAHTETGAAYGFARHEGFRQYGVTHKAWLTSHLPNVRVAHRDAEDDPRNARVPLDEAFYVGGERLMHPGASGGSPENVINCHCIEVVASGEEEDRRAA